MLGIWWSTWNLSPPRWLHAEAPETADQLCDHLALNVGACMTPGETVSKLRDQLHLTPRDIERKTADIAAVTQNQSFFLSHSQLHQVETESSVPGIFKVCGLAACLGISLEEMLGIYGIDIGLLREQFSLQLGTNCMPVAATQPNAMDLRQLVSSYVKTSLIDRDVQERLLLPLLGRRPDEQNRYTFGVIGKEDGSNSDPIPPGSIIQIDRSHHSKNGGSLSSRPIYFIWYDGGFTCSWGKLVGRDLTVIPFSPDRELFSLKVPRDAEIIGRVIGVIRFFLDP